MLVHALIAAVWTDPEPTVFAILDGGHKVFADLVGRRLLVALLGQDDGPQLLLVPVGRRLGLFLLLLLLSLVRVQVLLLRLALYRQVVRELALSALFAVALLEEDAHHRLGVDAKGHLLHLRGLVEQHLRLALGVLGRLLVALALGLFGLLALLLGAAAPLEVALDLGNLLLGGATFLILHAKGAVLDRLGGLLGLVALAFLGRHGGRLSFRRVVVGGGVGE